MTSVTCKLSAIVAVCDDWGIGCEGDMVVSNRADMRHFVACTKGHPVIMGRKTLLSFPGGRPLKNRRNIVLTRDEGFALEGVDVVHSVDEALAAVADESVAWVIGGGESTPSSPSPAAIVATPPACATFHAGSASRSGKYVSTACTQWLCVTSASTQYGKNCR